MSLLNGTGRHSADTEGWWKRQSRGAKVAIVTLGLLLTGALTAVAVLVVTQLAAQDSWTAKDIGNVEIGDVSTVGIYPDLTGLQNIEPGDSFGFQCFNVQVTSPQPGDNLKLYVDSASGTLNDHLDIAIGYMAHTGPAGHVATCEPGSFTTVFSGKVSAWAAAQFDFASGFDIPENAQIRVALALPGTVDGNVVKGTTGSLVAAFENQS